MATYFRTGDDSIQGGVDITLSLTPAEAAAIGGEASTLADWFDTALWALAILRTGHSVRPAEDTPARPITANDLHDVINDLDHRLIPRLAGVRDAAIRRHKELGGSVGDLALAMDVARSTAQTRREALEAKPRGLFETWALSGGPQR
jgi:hypothetical protein